MADPVIRFYDPRDPETGWLANFYRHAFRYEGSVYPTVEHCYQAQKFYARSGNEAALAHAHRIRQAATPREAKTLGQARDVPMARDRDDIKLQVMLKVVAAKFCCPEPVAGRGSCHPAGVELVQKLLSTGYARLIEASPTDDYWGEGAHGAGHNHLGRILMAIRDAIPSADHQAMQAYWDVEYTGDFYPKAQGKDDLWLWSHRDAFGDDGLPEGFYKRVVLVAWRLLHDPDWQPCTRPPGMHINAITGPLYGQSRQQMRECLRPWLGRPLQHIWAAQIWYESGDAYTAETAFVLEAIGSEGTGLKPLQIKAASQGRLGGIAQAHEFVIARLAAHDDGHAYAPWSAGNWPGKPTPIQKHWKDLLEQAQWPGSQHHLSSPPAQAVAWAMESVHVIPGENQDDSLKAAVPCFFQPVAKAVCLGLRAQDTQGQWLDAWRYLTVYGVTDEGMFPRADWTSNSPVSNSFGCSAICTGGSSVYGPPWKLILIGQSLGALPNIEAAFNKVFLHWAIELPADAIAEHHAIQNMDDGWDGLSGWSIDIAFGKDEGGEYLDVDSFHRMCGEGYDRYHEDGKTTGRDAPIAPERLASTDTDEATSEKATGPVTPSTEVAPTNTVQSTAMRWWLVVLAFLTMGSYLPSAQSSDAKPHAHVWRRLSGVVFLLLGMSLAHSLWRIPHLSLVFGLATLYFWAWGVLLLWHPERFEFQGK